MILLWKFPEIFLGKCCGQPVLLIGKNCVLQIQSYLIRDDILKKNFWQHMKLGVKFVVLDRLYLFRSVLEESIKD